MTAINHSRVIDAGPRESSRYEPLNPENLPGRLGDLNEVTALVGPADHWRVREVGDGNLNLVFIVEGRQGSVVVKQALPYARVVGESWPMSLDRTYFEYHALTKLGARDPGRMPRVHYFDRGQAVMVMEHLTPHAILRKDLIAGVELPTLGKHLGLYLARTLFRGSDFSLDTAERKADMALFAGNVELCGITEDLFFTDPFHDNARNRATDGLDVAAIHADRDLKLAAMEMKLRFCSSLQSLLHGDFHAGSVMVTPSDTRVIDAEFATYGPMGFDIGSLLANFWLAFFAQPAHRENPVALRRYQRWILNVTADVWAVFTQEFSRLWREERTGILGGRELFESQGDAVAPEIALQNRFIEIWQDTLGFAGLEMHRRILGLAHIPEFETIGDPVLRAECERRALAMGRQLVVHRLALPDLASANSIATIIHGFR
jgi:5-methylthioribose kinase